MWAKIDDGLAYHAKVVEAGNAAMGVWVRALSWCAQHLTDGHIPTKIARGIAGESRGALRALVDSGLWVEAPGGYQFTDYLDYNPSRAEVEEKRQNDRRRKAGGSKRTPGGTAAESQRLPAAPYPTRTRTRKEIDTTHGGGDDCPDFELPGAVSDIESLTGLMADWGWATQLSQVEIQRAHELLPMAAEEIELARSKAQVKGQERRVRYFLGVVRNTREDRKQNRSKHDAEGDKFLAMYNGG